MSSIGKIINGKYEAFANKGVGISEKDVQNASITFEESTERENINSKESLTVLFGKIKKVITDLKTVAFTGSYNSLLDRPSIPAAVAVKGNTETTYRTGNVNITPDNVGAVETSKIVNGLLTTAAGFVLDARQGKILDDKISDVKNNSWSLKGGIEIKPNEDLNSVKFRVPGNYFCPLDQTAVTLKNCPSTSGFTMKVYNALGDTNNYFITQEITNHYMVSYARQWSNIDNKWKHTWRYTTQGYRNTNCNQTIIQKLWEGDLSLEGHTANWTISAVEFDFILFVGYAAVNSITPVFELFDTILIETVPDRVYRLSKLVNVFNSGITLVFENSGKGARVLTAYRYDVPNNRIDEYIGQYHIRQIFGIKLV